jgi:hypothetical protein
LTARFLLHLALALFPFIQRAVSAEARKNACRYVSSHQNLSCQLPQRLDYPRARSARVR